MRFGEILLDRAEGCLLAHSMMVGGRKWAKGRVLTADDLAILGGLGITAVVVACLDPGDIAEDVAATTVARAVLGSGLAARAAATGRVNIHAKAAGLFTVDASTVDALNARSETVTLATLPLFEPVETDALVATVKIIPFAVAASLVAECIASVGSPALAVAPWRGLRVGLVQTHVKGTRDSVLDKTARTTAARVAACGGVLVAETRCAHRVPRVAQALVSLEAARCDLMLMIGASAITDRGDVLPQGLRAVGGCVDHVGMPVDPGNLLMLGQWGGRPVLGLPGCARSPRFNGADLVLRRLMAGLSVGARDIMGMGVGGLLSDVAERPLPRARVS